MIVVKVVKVGWRQKTAEAGTDAVLVLLYPYTVLAICKYKIRFGFADC